MDLSTMTVDGGTRVTQGELEGNMRHLLRAAAGLLSWRPAGEPPRGGGSQRTVPTACR